MESDLQRMPARYFALLCDQLKAEGLNVDSVLREAHISPNQIYGPNASLSTKQYEAMIDGLTRASGRSDLGFALGRLIKLSSHEILGYALITSPTLEYALQLACRYYRLITPAFRMQYRRQLRVSEVIFKPLLPLNARGFHFLLEVVVVTTLEQIKALLQDDFPASDVYVSYTMPEHVEHYRHLRPARFHYGFEDQPGARIVLDTALLSRRLPLTDKASLRMAEARCEELIQKTTQARRITEWVSMMLRESSNGFPTLGELARLQNQSPRTLDRQLQREGHRFLQLSKRIRHEKACELLLTSTQSVSQIALQLGYKETASFSRAFRREAGCSPTQYQSADTHKRAADSPGPPS